MRYLLVAFGGGIGSLARYIAGTAVMSRFGERFPLGTLVVNISGSFLIGLLMTLLTERFSPHPNWRLVLVVGFLGGYTTFSSFEWETYSTVREGGEWLGLANVVGSVILGYAAVWLGAVTVRRCTRPFCNTCSAEASPALLQPAPWRDLARIMLSTLPRSKF